LKIRFWRYQVTCVELRLPQTQDAKRWSSRWVTKVRDDGWICGEGEELSNTNPASFLFTKKSRKSREGSENRAWWSGFDKTLRHLCYPFFFHTVHSASNRAVKEPVVPLQILTAEIPLQWRDQQAQFFSSFSDCMGPTKEQILIWYTK